MMDPVDSTAATPGSPDELAAARAAFQGGRIARFRIAAGAFRALMRNPNDTRQVFLIGLVANVGAFPRFAARFQSTAQGARLMREQPTIDKRTVDFDALRAMPAHTLGGAYARYLDSNGLDPDLFQAAPGLPPVASFITKRLRQTHDIWHVLTGYKPDIPGEIELQAFTFAQTAMPSAALIATLGGIRWGLRHPGMPARLLHGFMRGYRAAFLPAVAWEDRWSMSLDQIRAELSIGS